MSRPCSVCTHPRRAEIDRALVKEVAERTLAKDFGLSRSAINRHKTTCAGLAKVGTKQVREARHEISRGTVALALLPSPEQLAEMYAALGQRIDAIVEAAAKQNSLTVALNGLGQLRQTWDSVSRLAGHTQPQPTQVNVNVAISAETIAANLVEALGNGRSGGIKQIEAIVCEPESPD
ncbi:hypothetical protein MPC4_90151 [Methylocella tundrae]|uniref:Uncharacterized protein n=1 Tax=Methylocella tundrae TaxID=227605 RepID=A0A8B6MDF6_METTU|nr:hypothetical protein MPC4_90151 [Methylocella tundrae]